MADRRLPKDEESPVARWSRRKQETRETDPAPADSEPQATPANTENQTENDDQADLVAALPSIDSLTADSDFTPFLDRAVPAELRRLALRKLWRSDPVFANLDGLNDYDDDFRTLGVGKIVRTAYQVGKGMVTRAEQAAQEAAPPSPADQTKSADIDPSRDAETAEAPADDDDTQPATET